MSQVKILSTISVVALAAFLVLSPFAVNAAGATVTVKTDSATYSGVQSLTVFGTVSPTPTTSGTNVVISVRNQATHAVVIFSEAQVSTTDGSYSAGFVTGGSAGWTTGTYVVNASYASGTTTGSATTTFSFSATQQQGGGISQAQFNQIMTVLNKTDADVATLQGTVANLQTAQSTQGSTISSISSSLTSLSGTVAAIQSAVSGLTGTVGTINTNTQSVQSSLASITPALQQAGQTQTYVLVVAVLTAITLVLVLAVLVRRLS